MKISSQNYSLVIYKNIRRIPSDNDTILLWHPTGGIFILSETKFRYSGAASNLFQELMFNLIGDQGKFIWNGREIPYIKSKQQDIDAAIEYIKQISF